MNDRPEGGSDFDVSRFLEKDGTKAIRDNSISGISFGLSLKPSVISDFSTTSPNNALDDAEG
jgi:hypothetical protein